MPPGTRAGTIVAMVRHVLFDPTAPDHTASYSRYDHQLLMNSFVHRVDDPEVLDAAARRLSELGWVVLRLDAGRWTREADLYDGFAGIFGLPDGYGRSGLDALADALSDVAEFTFGGADPASTGTAVLIRHHDVLDTFRPGLAHAVLDAFAREARLAALYGHPMLCLVESPEPFADVGAAPVLEAHTPH
ncbi:barnase inhibitor [Pseudonocardia sp. P1]